MKTAVLLSLSAPVALAGFVRQQFLPGTTPCNSTLQTEGAPPAKCVQRTDPKATLPCWSHSIDFDFGTVEESQFKKLSGTYASWWGGEATVNYDKAREYTLTDFLPPPMQALQGLQFKQEELPRPSLPYPASPDTYKNSILVPNCWATVHEVLRFAALQKTGSAPAASGAPYYVLSTADQEFIVFLQTETAAVSGANDASGLPSDRQPGDVFLLWIDQPTHKYRKRLAHAVTLVDANIGFEKSGSGDTTPYRLTDIASVQAAWRPDIFKYEVRRPKLGKSGTLTPVQRFSIVAATPNSTYAEFWRWPKDMQLRYDLAIADADDGKLEGFTLLEIREYCIKKSGPRWEVCKLDTEAVSTVVI